MIELLKIHWYFIRRPTFVLDNYIRPWPAGLAIGVFVLLELAGAMSDNEMINMHLDMAAAVDREHFVSIYYLWHFLSLGYLVLIYWIVMPPIVRKISPLDTEVFDPDLYRKLIMMSGTGYLIFLCFAKLPFSILLRIVFATNGSVLNSITNVLGIWAVISAFEIWVLVCLVMSFVITWKGLGRFFSLSSGKRILVIFVIPLPLLAPVWIPALYVTLNYLTKTL